MNSEKSGSTPHQPGICSPIGLALLFAVFVVMHFQSLTGLSLTADDDHAVFREDSGVWIQQGRWGAYLVERFILPLPVITFLPYALFGACLSLSFALLAISLGISTVNWTVLLAFGLFIGVPQWLFVMEFSANLAPIGVGFLCASGSALAFYKASDRGLSGLQRILRAAPSIVLLCLAASLYQSLLVAGLLMSSAVIVVRLARAEVSIPATLWMHVGIAIAGALAYALCIAVNNLFLFFLPNLQRLTWYFDTLLKPLEAVRNPERGGTAALWAYKNIVWGDKGFYGVNVLAFGMATVVASVTLIVMAFRSGIVRGLLVVLWVLAAWLATLAFQFAAAGAFVPFRIMLPLTALVAILALVSITAKRAKALILLVFAVAVYQEIVVINRAAAAHELVAKRDAYIAGDLFRRVASVGRPGPDGLYRIQTLGVSPGLPTYAAPGDSHVALSWFAHLPFNSYRAAGYMRMLGYPVSLADAPAAAFSEQWATMPSWPADGSVVASGHVTLIKLNDVPGISGNR